MLKRQSLGPAHPAVESSWRVGSGSPMIVIHGGPGLEHSYLEPWLRPLERHRTLVYYDQVGCGDLGNASTIVTAEDTLKQLLALIGSYTPDTRIGLFAHSWGTFLALAALAEVPRALISEVVLCNPFALTWKRFQQSNERLLRRIPHDVLTELESLEPATDPVGTRVMELILPYYLSDPARVPEITFRSYRNSVNHSVFASIDGFDIRSSADLLPDRTLILYGRDDFILPTDSVELQNDPTQIAVIDRAGHFPFAEQPREFLANIIGLLAEDPAAV